MKRFGIIILIIILLLIGVLAGVYVYNKNKTENINIINKQKLAIKPIENNDEIISASATDEKISPNASVLEKQYFKGCDHLIKNMKDIPQELINKSREEVEKYYTGWAIDNFSANEITIYQEKDGYCNEHYLIKENNGVLGIYTLDENGKLTFKEDTEIETMYLTEEDLEKVKDGIVAIGDMELNTILEDFE